MMRDKKRFKDETRMSLESASRSKTESGSISLVDGGGSGSGFRNKRGI